MGLWAWLKSKNTVIQEQKTLQPCMHTGMQVRRPGMQPWFMTLDNRFTALNTRFDALNNRFTIIGLPVSNIIL